MENMVLIFFVCRAAYHRRDHEAGSDGRGDRRTRHPGKQAAAAAQR